MRIVGIDLGERRIGVAVSDASATLARPLKTIERGTSDAGAVERLHAMIAELAADDEVGSVVVGLPLRLDGSASPQTSRVRAMVALLSARLTIPVCDAGRAAVEPRSRGAVGGARKGLAETEGEARRGGGGGDTAGLPGCQGTDRAEGRGQRAESRRGHGVKQALLALLALAVLPAWAWPRSLLHAHERAVQGLRRRRAVRHDRAGQRHAHNRAASHRSRRHPRRTDLSRCVVAKRPRAQPAGRGVPIRCAR